jgi:RNA polymerase sigma-70 factor (ECF subfamily)
MCNAGHFRLPTCAPGANVNQDEILLNRARAFDEQALGEIYDAYFGRLYRYAYRFVGDVASAQDIAAETLRRLLEALRDGRAPNHLGAWLYRVAYNLAMDQHRQRPAGGLVSLEPDLDQADETDTEIDSEHRLAQEKVRQALERLTPEQQNVVVLKFMEGYSNAEVGTLMNKPEGAIKSLQHRALAALKRALTGLLVLL